MVGADEPLDTLARAERHDRPKLDFVTEIAAQDANHRVGRLDESVVDPRRASESPRRADLEQSRMPWQNSPGPIDDERTIGDVLNR